RTATTSIYTLSLHDALPIYARGKLKFTDDENLVKILKRTTDHFENDPHSPAGFDKLSPDYIQQLSKAIFAFEIEVESMDHVFKLDRKSTRLNSSHVKISYAV